MAAEVGAQVERAAFSHDLVPQLQAQVLYTNPRSLHVHLLICTSQYSVFMCTCSCAPAGGKVEFQVDEASLYDVTVDTQMDYAIVKRLQVITLPLCQGNIWEYPFIVVRQCFRTVGR
jgi:hypothetical protein